MTEAEWMVCYDPIRMVQSLGGQLTAAKQRQIPLSLRKRLNPRKFRLFGCACCRRVWGWLTTDNAKKAVESAERYADKKASDTELLDAHETARNTSPDFDPGWPDSGPLRDETGKSKYASDYPGWKAHQAALNVSSGNFARTADVAVDAGDDKQDELAAQCELLRCIVGNPFNHGTFLPEWHTSTVVALAQQMYESRDFSAMPILADALQDAGCDNEDILHHCRDEMQVHVRGCWVVDLVLGKS